MLGRFEHERASKEPGSFFLGRFLIEFGYWCFSPLERGALAMGWADLIVEQQLGLYDIAGVAPIISGAGGYIADWNGKPIDSSFNGKAVAASSKALAEEALKVLMKS